MFGRPNICSEAIINTRALCLYLLIVAAWRRAVSCALLGTVENGPQIDYDMMNRNWRVVKPSGATFTKSYDPNGNVSRQADGENNTTAHTCNSMCWCTQTTDAAAKNFDKIYDAIGRVATETVSPDGGQTLYTTSYPRNALGNLAGRTSDCTNIRGGAPTSSFVVDRPGCADSCNEDYSSNNPYVLNGTPTRR